MGVLDRLRSPTSPRLSVSSFGGNYGHSRSSSHQVSNVDHPDVEVGNAFEAPKPHQPRWSTFGRPKTVVPKPLLPTESKDTPAEMIPVLTLLAAHGARVYNEGYFMLLADLKSDGSPVGDRRWIEVFGTLAGSVLTTWDATALDSGDHEVSAYLNISDATIKSVEWLQTPQGDLEHIIVLSTTMRNRYLLQFGSRKLFDEWTAALRLSVFELQSLQEAYTGALLSAKGTHMHGIRALLTETKHEKEERCSVRFGPGMPWLEVRVLIIPPAALKHKKERKQGYGRVEIWDTPLAKPVRKGRLLAVVHRATSAFAVFPERSVLMNVSTLIKLEGQVTFENEKESDGSRESSVFLMPNPRPGIQGFEVLIRTIIPLMDVFQLYGRPRRLNADKADINSMLFAMPTLPKAYYSDTMDIYMLTALDGSGGWTHSDWMKNIKELLARKMATGYRGTGDIHKIASSSASESGSSTTSPQKARAVSEPHGVPGGVSWNKSTSSFELSASNSSGNTPGSSTPVLAPSHTPVNDARSNPPFRSSPLRPAPAAPNKQANAGIGAAANLHTGATASSSQATLHNPNSAERVGIDGSSKPNLLIPSQLRPDGPTGPRAQPKTHERALSEGMDRNNLVVAKGQGLLTPNLGTTESDSEGELDRDSFMSAHSGTGTAKDSTNDVSSKTRLEMGDVFDPTYRPSHMSYADYSEYMRSFIDRQPTAPTSGPEDEARTSESNISRLAPPFGADGYAKDDSDKGDSLSVGKTRTSPGRKQAYGESQIRKPSGPRDMRDVSNASIRSVGKIPSGSDREDAGPVLKEVRQGSPKMQNQPFGMPTGPRPYPGGPRIETPPPTAVGSANTNSPTSAPALNYLNSHPSTTADSPHKLSRVPVAPSSHAPSHTQPRMPVQTHGQPAVPYGTQPRPAVPYGSQPKPAVPYGSMQQPSAPYGSQQQPSAPYGSQPQPAAPYGSQPQPAAPYGSQPQLAAPYGSQPHPAVPYGSQTQPMRQQQQQQQQQPQPRHRIPPGSNPQQPQATNPLSGQYNPYRAPSPAHPHQQPQAPFQNPPRPTSPYQDARSQSPLHQGPPPSHGAGTHVQGGHLPGLGGSGVQGYPQMRQPMMQQPQQPQFYQMQQPQAYPQSSPSGQPYGTAPMRVQQPQLQAGTAKTGPIIQKPSPQSQSNMLRGGSGPYPSFPK